ncbi:MAG: sugar phosphate isomerase/epimerase [Chloroflexota bacterium]|nr:MAG: sugar phosphate isomerase/epimerase [Chloroflexota bacterium]
MELGAFDKVFQRPTFEDALDALVAVGGRAIQFHLSSLGLEDLPYVIGPAQIARARKACESHGVAMTAVSGMFNMAHPDPAVRADGLKRLDAVCAAGGGLGTSVVGVCTGSRNTTSMWRAHPDNRSPEAWRDLAATMAPALASAERYGVILAMEPEVNNVVDSGRAARRLIDEMGSRNLKVCIDGANIFHSGELPRMDAVLGELFDLIGGDIAFAHAKDLDHDGDAGHLAPGHGVLDFDRYLRLLEKNGYRGAIIMHGLTEQQAPRCFHILGEKLARLGQ